MKSLTKSLIELKQIDDKISSLIDRGSKQNSKEFFKELLSNTYEFHNLREQIKSNSIDNSVIEMRNPEAKHILTKINNNERFNADILLELLSNNKSLKQFLPLTISPQNEEDYNRIDEEQLEELAMSEFYSWFGPYTYFWNLIEIGVLIVDKKVHPTVEKFVDEARQCYAFERYNAVYSICRTMIESALRDVGVRVGKIKPVSNSKDFYKEYPPSTLIKAVTKNPLRNRIFNIYGDLSELIHGYKNIDRSEAKSSLRQSINLVEKIYTLI